MQAKILSFNMALAILAVALMLGTHSMVKGERITDEVERKCYGKHYDKAYGDNLKEALNDLVNQAPLAAGHAADTNHGNVYVEGNCKEGLSEDDCGTCLLVARSTALKCNKDGAIIGLAGCDISYQNHDFDD